MKTSSERPRVPPGPPGGIRARAVYAGFVGLTIVAITVGFVGLVTANGAAVLAATGAGGLAWCARDWLIQRGEFDAAARCFDEPAGEVEAPEEGPVNELVGLLREWDELERRRGSPDFDPWAVQSLRRDIQRVVDETPALRTLIQR